MRVLPDPKEALALQTPNRQRIRHLQRTSRDTSPPRTAATLRTHLAARHVQYDASRRRVRNRGVECGAGVHDLAFKGEGGELEVVWLAEPQEELGGKRGGGERSWCGERSRDW